MGYKAAAPARLPGKQGVHFCRLHLPRSSTFGSLTLENSTIADVSPMRITTYGYVSGLRVILLRITQWGRGPRIAD